MICWSGASDLELGLHLCAALGRWQAATSAQILACKGANMSLYSNMRGDAGQFR